MDIELVSGSLSDTEGSERKNCSAPLFTYTEQFYQQFPFYLSIGMTYDQYWNEDCSLVIYYRKANELRNARKNQELWLQGMYIYDAICEVSPVLHAFAPSGTKPSPYTKEPYALTHKEIREKEERAERARMQAMKSKMETLMVGINQKFIGEEDNPDGNNNRPVTA